MDGGNIGASITQSRGQSAGCVAVHRFLVVFIKCHPNLILRCLQSMPLVSSLMNLVSICEFFKAQGKIDFVILIIFRGLM